MEWDEGSTATCPYKAAEVQAHDIAKGADTIGHTRIRGNDCQKTVNGETACMVGGGFRRIWKRLHPRCKEVFLGAEFDMREEVPSRPRNP